MTRTLVAIAVAGLASVALVSLLGQSENLESSMDEPKLRAEVDRLERQVRSLERDRFYAQVREQGEETEERGRLLETVDSGEGSQRDESAAPSSEELEQRRVARREELQESWDNEAIDGPWAREMEHSLRGTLSSDSFLGTTVQSIECRTSRCRVMTSHEDSQSTGQLGQEFPMQLGEDARGTIFVDDEAGVPTSTIYLTFSDR